MDGTLAENSVKETCPLIESTLKIKSKTIENDEKVTEDNEMDVDIVTTPDITSRMDDTETSTTTTTKEDSCNKDESKLKRDTNELTLNSSSDSPTVNVQEASTRSGNFVKPVEDSVEDSVVVDNTGYILYKSMKVNCKAVEEQAMDFISELHHPAISCFREITRADFNNVIQNLKSSTESTELEQCIIIIGMMDYIAVSLKNPLYNENFAKIQTCVHGCIKKLFLELRRIMKEWADTDFAGFSKANDLIIKYLRGLQNYFKVINFDDSYKSALQLLSKEANRYRIKHKGVKSRPNAFEERLALMEIVNKSFEEKKDKKETDSLNVDKDRDIDDDDFKCLDVPPSKNLSTLPPAPVFLKSQKNKKTSTISKSAELMKQFCDSAKINGIKNENKVINLKRPATESLEISPTTKKVCTSSLSTPKDEKDDAASLSTSSSDTVSKNKNKNTSSVATPPAKVSSKSAKATSKSAKTSPDSAKTNSTSAETSSVSAKPSFASASSTSSPQKPTVNAFMLMMNKSRELSKTGKLKKDNVKTPKTTTVTTKVK